jgi:hypothetical protein
MTAQVIATHVWPTSHEMPVAVEELVLDWGGPVGDRHPGLTMLSDTRQRSVFDQGTEIRNHRQLSLVDSEELADIAESMGIDGIAPGVIADNICTTGIAALTSLPR